MAGELVETITEDGLRLQGWLQQAEPETAIGRVCIIVHGVAGNFYNSSLLAAVAESLLQYGYDVLRINTRGRDAVCYLATQAGQTRGGAAFETLSDARVDLAAWQVWVKSRLNLPIDFLGHSLGAVKIVETLTSQRPSRDELVAPRVMLLSPPRLSAPVLAQDRKYAQQYVSDREQAQQAMQAGRPETLFTIRFPQPMLISAATYLDKYGGEQYDYLAKISSLPRQVWWCFGEHEVRGPRASFSQADQVLLKQMEASPERWRLQQEQSVDVVPGADHAYTGCRTALQGMLLDWLRSLPSSSGGELTDGL